VSEKKSFPFPFFSSLPLLLLPCSFSPFFSKKETKSKPGKKTERRRQEEDRKEDRKKTESFKEDIIASLFLFSFPFSLVFLQHESCVLEGVWVCINCLFM